MFDNEEMTKWEKKTKYDKMWVNVTAYFEDLIGNIETYQSNSRGNTKREQQERITNIRQDLQEKLNLLVCFDTLSESASFSEDVERQKKYGVIVEKVASKYGIQI